MPSKAGDESPPPGARRLGGRGLLDASISRGEVARRVKIVAERLAKLDQDDRPPDLDETAKALVNTKIIESTDKEVKLYAAKALADILRVYAPDAPYSSVVLLQVFSLIISQLRGLSSVTANQAETQGMNHPVLYLLHNIATVKSCIIMSELVQQGLPRAEEELVELYSCLLNSCREDHSAALQEQMVTVLCACVEELEVVPEPLLDTVLLCFTVDNKRDSPPTYKLAQTFVARCFEKLNTHLSTFVKQVLTGRASGASEEVGEEILQIIYELQRINPGIMVHIFPHVSTQLHSEDTGVRGRAISLLGRLFSASHADYGEEYQRIFREFLGRFVDKEANIRSQMLGIGAFIVQRKPKLADAIVPYLVTRLKDHEWEVRGKAAKELCDVAAKSLELLSAGTIKDLAERIKDKRASTRQEMIGKLASLYESYISRKLVEDEEDGASSIPDDVTEKLGFIPSIILCAYSIPHHETRDHVLQAFEEVLLPLKASTAARTNVLVYIWSGLKNADKAAFRRMLSDKARVQEAVLKLLRARSAWREDQEDEAKEVELQSVQSSLLELVPPSDKKHANKSLFTKLNQTKDQQAPKLFKVLMDPRQSLKAVGKARDDLIAKMGTKTPLGDYIRVLSRRGSVVVGNVETFLDLISHARAMLEDEDMDDEDEDLSKHVGATVEVMELLIHTFPPLLQGTLPELLELCWSACRDDALQIRILRLMAQVKLDDKLAGSKPRFDDRVVARFRSEVTKLCMKDGSAKAARKALLAMCNLLLPSSTSTPASSGGEDHTLIKILKDLVQGPSKPLTPDNPRIEAVLRCLAVYAERLPSLFEPYADHVRVFVLNKLLRRGGDGLTPDADAPLPDIKGRGRKGSMHKKGKGREAVLSPECLRLCASLKLLVAHVLGLRLEDTPAASQGDESTMTFSSKKGGDEAKDKGAAAQKVSVSKETLEATAGEVLDLLFQVLEAEGESPDGANLNRAEKARVRLVCAGGVLKLMRNRHVQHRLMTTDRWRNLAWVMLDSDSGVTSAFNRKLARAVCANKVHLKFFAILCLTAGEQSPDVKAYVTSAVTHAVQKHRQAYEQYMATHAENLSEDDRRTVTTAMMPEYVLPYMLHLLAHYPDFPEGHDDTHRWKHLRNCMAFLLDPLMATLGHEADNLSFLLLLTDTILTSDYVDATMPTSIAARDKLHAVTRVCRDYLQSKIKMQENLQAFPGKIYLPAQLYRKQATNRSSAASSNRDSTALPDWGSPIEGGMQSRRSSIASPPMLSHMANAGSSTKKTSAKKQARTRKAPPFGPKKQAGKGRKRGRADSSDEDEDDDEEEEEEEEDDDDVFGSIRDVSSSKDRSAAKPRRSSLSPVGSLLASQKGRQKAAARAKSGAGKSSARKSAGYASEDSLGFHEGDDEEEEEEKAAGKKAADDEEAMSLKLSAEEQKDARMQRAAKRGLKPSQDEGSMAASETSSRTTGAKGKGKKKGASAKDETAPEKEDGKEALSQASAASSASMAPPPSPHSLAAPSATDDDSLRLMLSQESNQSFFTAGRSVTSAPAADAMEVDEQAAQPDEEKVEEPKGKSRGRKKKEEVEEEEEEEANSTAAVAAAEEEEDEEQEGAEEADTKGRGRKRKAAPTKPAATSGGAAKKGKVTAPAGGRRGKAKAPEPAKEENDADEEEEDSEDDAAAAAARRKRALRALA